MSDKHEVPGEFEVVGCDLPPFVGDWSRWSFPDASSPRLVELRERYRLDEVVAGQPTELAAFLALKRWVRSRWDHGWSPESRAADDALDLLDAAAGGACFCCGDYVRVFVACAAALGWPARPVGVSLAGNAFPRGWDVGNVGHAVAEIWWHERRRWIVMDCDLNVHYERDGVPMSALEIHDAWLAGEAAQVAVIPDEPRFAEPSEESLAHLRTTFAEFATMTRSDLRQLLARFDRHRAMDYYARLRIGGWEYLDPRCLPGFVSHYQPAAELRSTSSVADLYPTVDLVRPTCRPAWSDGQARLTVRLEHCQPWFDHYQRRIDGAEWLRCDESFEWLLHAGVNRLECRAVNALGRAGTACRLDVSYAPARW